MLIAALAPSREVLALRGRPAGSFTKPSRPAALLRKMPGWASGSARAEAGNPRKQHALKKTRLYLPLLLIAVAIPMVGVAGHAWGAESEAEEVPTAELAHGKIGADEWAAAAMAPEENKEREEGWVCLAIFFLEVLPHQEGAEGSEGAQCGELGTHEIMFESHAKHRGRKRPHSAVAFLLDESASRMVLKLKGQGASTIRLRHLPPQEATSGRRLAYFARGYARPFCLQNVTAYNAAGERVAHMGGWRCL